MRLAAKGKSSKQKQSFTEGMLKSRGGGNGGNDAGDGIHGDFSDGGGDDDGGEDGDDEDGSDAGDGGSWRALILIVLIQLLAFVLWHSISVTAISAFIDDLATQINYNVIRRTKLLLSEPVLVQSINTLISVTGGLPYIPVTTTATYTAMEGVMNRTGTADFFDAHFSDQARIFDKIDLIFSGDDDKGRFQGE
jgi:hypothetical protein